MLFYVQYISNYIATDELKYIVNEQESIFRVMHYQFTMDFLNTNN